MIGRVFRKAVALVLMFFGAVLVSSMVDMSPVVGSPQIDYPGFDMTRPFWLELTSRWLTAGLGGGLLAALGATAWSDTPPPTGMEAPRVLRAWALWCVVVGGVSLALFLTYGTMGPLGVPQPIVRFAATNGAVTASVIVLLQELIVGPAAVRLRAIRNRGGGAPHGPTA